MPWIAIRWNGEQVKNFYFSMIFFPDKIKTQTKTAKKKKTQSEVKQSKNRFRVLEEILTFFFLLLFFINFMSKTSKT